MLMMLFWFLLAGSIGVGIVLGAAELTTDIEDGDPEPDEHAAEFAGGGCRLNDLSDAEAQTVLAAQMAANRRCRGEG